jgi:hypothetical protein
MPIKDGRWSRKQAINFAVGLSFTEGVPRICITFKVEITSKSFMALTDEQRAEPAKQAEVEHKTCLEMMEKRQFKSPRSTNRKIRALTA